MFRSARAIVTALLATVVTMAVPADPAAAATCSTRSTSAVSGGYDVLIYCSGAGFIDGFGSTLTDANLEALFLYQLYADTGVLCDGRSASGVSGGYDVLVYCSGAGFIDGFGSTLTDAAGEARALGELYAEQRRSCDGRRVSVVSGGYDVLLYCSGLGFINGVGSTLTGAARTARLAATIG